MSVGSKADARRRMLWGPVFSLTLVALITGAGVTGAGVAQAAAPVLPTGGKVTAGSAVIGPSSGGTLSITQSSSKAIIDWSSFSIGKGGDVAFNNGKGATLNRVTGAGVSSLDGLLTGTGSVYLINPNGLIIGRSGVVNVGGAFVASTLDTSDAGFLSGGALSFSGASNAAVINYGRLGALGGDVALIAARVENDGAISAANGDAGLLAGYRVVLKDASLDDGRFAVMVGGAGTSATNAGLIQAADAELRAEGGNVYALAGDTAGVIRATGVKSGGGKVWLVAEGGELDLGGAITAQAPGGTGGAIETSGGTVKIGDTRIDAHGGTWRVDPYDLTIDATAASAIDNALNAGTSVTEQTTANGYGGAGVASASGEGDIIVAAPITWSTTAGLTLSAYRNVAVNAALTVAGGGALTVITDNSGAGNGGALLFDGGSVQFPSFANGQPQGSLSIGVGAAAPTAYTLVADLKTLSADIAANNSGAYALAAPIDASRLTYTTVPLSSTEATPFAGVFEGLGNSISNLTINDTTDFDVGLFGQTGVGSVVRDVAVLEGAVNVGQSSAYAGELAGLSSGMISNTYSTGSVTSPTDEQGYLGGLVGINQGLISQSHSAATVVNGAYAGGLVANSSGKLSNVYATGAVSGGGFAGGLASLNQGDILDAYATGAVVASGHAGGLVSGNIGDIEQAYASGAVSGPFAGGLASFNMGVLADVYATGSATGPFAAGLVSSTSGNVTNAYASGAVSGGFSGGFAYSNTGVIADAYYDQGSTGQSIAISQSGASQDGVVAIGGSTGLSPYSQSTYKTFTFGTGGAWFLLEGGTRPFLQSEYSTTIANAHQLQLVAMNLSADYTLVGAVDASGTSGLDPSGMWSPAGFVPLGTPPQPFAGVLDGRGDAINGLTISLVPKTSAQPIQEVGLFQDVGSAGQILDLTLNAVSISGVNNVGAVAGQNFGLIRGVHANGTVAGVSIPAVGDNPALTSINVGGLVGRNLGILDQVSFSGVVSGDMEVGGLAGETENDDIGQNPDGSIGNSYSTAAVTGMTFVGGLVGSSTYASISASYASGLVKGSDAVGGLIGSSFAGSVSDAYWDIGTTGQAVGVGPNDYGNSATQTEVVGIGGASGANPYASSTYSGLDFSITGPWTIIEGATRPLLKTEYSTTITNAHQLQLIDLDLTAQYVVAADIDLSGSNNPSEVWSPAGFAPIGNGIYAEFQGGFDGQGHTIANLTQNTVGNGGLFSSTLNGVLQNVTLSNVSIATADEAGALATDFFGLLRNVSVSGRISGGGQLGSGGGVGGLVGTNGGQISGATADVAVSGLSQVGGLVGVNTGTITASASSGPVNGVSQLGGFVGVNSGVIDSSYASGAVAGSSGKGQPAGSAYQIGGFAGFSDLSSNSLITSALVDDVATGAVSGDFLVGGFAGASYSPISNSHATGAVSGTPGDGDLYGIGSRIGGFIGENIGTIDSDYATGTVIGTTQVGGFAGWNAYAPVANSYATGSVSEVSTPGAHAGAGSLFGGFAGENEGTINTSHASGVAIGYGQVGGLIGRNDASGLISFSYATGAVSAASGKGAPQGSGAQVGGLIGENLGGVSTSYAVGQASGTSQIGGLIGYNSGAVADTYATGAVSGSSGKGGLVGFNDRGGMISTSYATGAGGVGFAGTNNGTLASDVFDEAATKTTIGVGSGSSAGLTAIGGATGLDPYQASSYAGFDFTNTWTIDPGASRPYLQAIAQSPPPT